MLAALHLLLHLILWTFSAVVHYQLCCTGMLVQNGTHCKLAGGAATAVKVCVNILIIPEWPDTATQWEAEGRTHTSLKSPSASI